MTESPRPRLVLLGYAAARPEGLERALVRSGFQVMEAPPGWPERGEAVPPDLIVLTLPHPDDALKQELDRLDTTSWRRVPRLVTLADPDREATTKALLLGADDAMGAPINFAELNARLNAKLRSRASWQAAEDWKQLSELKFDILQEVSAAIRSDELVETLVRRVGLALDLAHCSFLLVTPGERFGRVVAVCESPATRDLQVDLNRYPEIIEAISTGRAVFVPDVRTHPLFDDIRPLWAQQGVRVNIRSVAVIPVLLQGRTTGVFLLRTREEDPNLRPEQVEFAETLAHAATRLLENEERRSAILRRQSGAASTDMLTGCGSLDALDRRIRDEFERARRYALSFSLILLDVDQLRRFNERYGAVVGDRVMAELGGILQRELRAPDFVSRYGGDEFALVLPETDVEGARRSVGRVRECIQNHAFPELDPADRPKLSAGIVTFPHPSAAETRDLFALVEAALLRGKSQTDGRIGTAESVAA